MPCRKRSASSTVPDNPASFALSFLWLEKNVAVAVDQVFSEVRYQVSRCMALLPSHVLACTLIAAALGSSTH